jgi:hypothetical protein
MVAVLHPDFTRRGHDSVEGSAVKLRSREFRNSLLRWIAVAAITTAVAGSTALGAQAASPMKKGAISIRWKYLDYQDVYRIPASQIQRDFAPYLSSLPKITVQNGSLNGCQSVSMAGGSIGPYPFNAMMCQTNNSSGSYSFDWVGRVDGQKFHIDYPYSGGQLILGWNDKPVTLKVTAKSNSGVATSWSFNAGSTLVRIIQLGIPNTSEPGVGRATVGSGFIGKTKVTYKIMARAGEVIVPEGNVSATIGHGEITGTYSIK